MKNEEDLSPIHLKVSVCSILKVHGVIEGKPIIIAITYEENDNYINVELANQSQFSEPIFEKLLFDQKTL